VDLALRGFCFAAALLVCLPAWMLMGRIFERSEFYGHGYLIPVVALFLLYRDRTGALTALRGSRPPSSGPWLALCASLVEILAVMGDLVFAAGLGVPLVLGAAAFAVGGRAFAARLALPTSFLALMVPPPGFLTDRLLFELKLFVTDVSVATLQALGQPVAAEGNQLLIPGHALFVADACSGLTSVVTLLPVAVVVAYFLGRGIWRRAALVASVLPLAVGANVLRVVLTVLFVSSLGADYAQGLLHETFSVSTYLVGTLALLGVARLLR
jgi:exosortase